MTRSGILRVEEDGTRVYANYLRYKPVPLEDRKIGVNKPDDPRAQRFYGRWFLPLPLVPDEARIVPETRPDTDAYDHALITVNCRCRVCMRPQAQRWRNKLRKEQGLRPIRKKVSD